MDGGVKYKGEVNFIGQREGKGLQEWADGTVYIGEWYKGMANGYGRLRHPDGEIYEG